MKKLIGFFLILSVLLACSVSASAAGGSVTYDGEARKFIFAPGSEHSPTDLFEDFKGVMPGDSLTQDIAVVNEAYRNVKVKIYMRALGAHDDSVDFLSQLKLRVKKADSNTMGYMFDAAADETAQLTDWVCLGTLYSGGKVDLQVLLDVPTSLDNTYSDQIGYLDWQFKVEEFPIEDTDPKPPQTGDDSKITLWIGAMVLSGCILLLLIIGKKRKDQVQ